MKSGKLRILLCSENVSPQLNGVARRVGEYEKAYLQNGHNVDVLHPYCTGKTWTLPHPWNSNAAMMMIRPMYFLNLVLSDVCKYDVIHAVLPLNFSGAWILAATEILRALDYSSRQKKYPALVISYHLNAADYIDVYSPPVIRDFQKILMFQCLSRVLPLISDRVLAPTHSTEPRLLKLWPMKRRGICHTGISSDFCPAAVRGSHGQNWLTKKEDFLKKTGKKHLLLCVGRLAPEKGILQLLEALPILSQSCALWIVGDGPFRSQAEEYVSAHKLPVEFLGYQRNEALYSVYGAADCFVCPSQTETYGQVVQEALATGARVTLPRVPQFVEAYEKLLDKSAWWEPNDTLSMVGAIDSQVQLGPLSDKNKDKARSMLMTWSEASDAMLLEYAEALKVAQNDKKKLNAVQVIAVLLWILVTLIVNSLGQLVYNLANMFSNVVSKPRFYLKQ